MTDNETRFVWLGRAGSAAGWPGGTAARRGPVEDRDRVLGGGLGGARLAGRLPVGVRRTREVNLTRIESRPRKQGLGRYMFFCDLEGRDTEPHVAAALEGLAGRVEVLRTLGSFPAA